MVNFAKTEFTMTRSRKITIGIITVIIVLGIIRLIPDRSFDVDTKELLRYCKSNGYSDKYCILVDFSKPQGINRFAIYSFADNKVIAKSLCAQGRGRENNIFCRKFSNEIGSNYSSLGHYRVGRLRPMLHPFLWFFNDGYEVHGLDSKTQTHMCVRFLSTTATPALKRTHYPAFLQARAVLQSLRL
ncbi:MAG: murein L,D-transpeptidase catalytic domain family protein [Alistipes sp.]|nr:murein L,D-transpeptidase catalytic domain family protein [Alistipes sp.]